MQPFSYHRPSGASQAIEVARSKAAQNLPPHQAPGQFIAGGTNMMDYMKLNVVQPEELIDINQLSDPRYREIQVDKDGLHLGALVRMSQAEDHPIIQSQYPIIYDTLRLAASRQIRNMASLGGNPLQRTRCEYFRGTSWPCNKRRPGSGCAALDGLNRQHAAPGTSEHCIATYPGDFAQALVALAATVETLGPNGTRTIAFSDLHRLPGDTPHIETVLESGELITAIHVPAGPWTRRSCYIKVRDRQSYQFALTSAAVALDLDGDAVRDIRIALGGVATIPWRAREAEMFLAGKKLDESTATAAADAAFAGAKTRQHNAFKVQIGKETLIRALLEARTMEI